MEAIGVWEDLYWFVLDRLEYDFSIKKETFIREGQKLFVIGSRQNEE